MNPELETLKRMHEAAFVSDIARGNREPSGKVLQYLGLAKDVRRVVIFFRP